MRQHELLAVELSTVGERADGVGVSKLGPCDGLGEFAVRGAKGIEGIGGRLHARRPGECTPVVRKRSELGLFCRALRLRHGAFELSPNRKNVGA